MKRVDLLIDDVREDTDNSEFSEETGIPDSKILRALNRGQERIHSLILNADDNGDVKLEEKEIDAVQGQEAYSIPIDCFGGTRIRKIEYSRTGLERDYYPLDQRQLRQRDSYTVGEPEAYIKRDRTFLLNPRPQSAGKIRVSYQKRIPRLDIRRGTVESATLDSGARSITSLVLDDSVLMESELLVNYGFATIVDKDGNVKMRAIPIDSIASDGTVTVRAGFTYESGETIAAGNFILLGENSSTHSQLDEICEKYLVSYANWRIQKGDSSNDAPEEGSELQLLEEEIVATYKEADKDVDRIPIISSDFLYNDERY